ncbi:MAG: hypothetical protein K8I60_19685 [Anaerolineae bacterium]|nr:hypothetical protein [Anaerolineae bacterium]
MRPLETLYRLQEIELEILAGHKRLREITAALQENQALAAAQSALDAAQKQLAPLHKQSRSLELELQSNRDKSRQAEDRLYSGAVKNPKELQDIQQEIAALKKRSAELEDHLLEVMLAVEDAEAAVQQADTELRQISSALSTGHGQLIEERDTLKGRDTTLRQQREQVMADIPPELLQLYNTMRPRKNNQPVALLKDQSCSACGVEQNRMVADAARRGQDVVYCVSCERILFAR